MADFDTPWKEILDHYFEAFVAFFFPTIHAEIDWPRGYEFLDKELQQIVRESRSGRLYVDKLVKVWRKDGREGWLLIHIEVQGQPERGFARRMFLYNCRLADRYNRRVISLAVLSDTQPGWRPDRYRNELWGCSTDFRFPIVKLLDYQGNEAALEGSPNPFATVVLAHLKTLETRKSPQDRKSWKFRLIKGLLDRGWTAVDVRRLWLFIDWIMTLPPGLERQVKQEIYEYEEKTHMPYICSFQREGRAEGYLKGIENALEIKFGSEGLDLLPEIAQLEDHEVLLEVLTAIKSVQSPAELRKIWKKRRKRKN